MSAFRIVIFTSAEPCALHHLICRLRTDLRDAAVIGILYETARPQLSFKRRLKRIAKYIRDPGFIQFAAGKIASPFHRVFSKALTRLLHVLHGTVGSPNPPAPSLKDIAAECKARGMAFRLTDDIHDESSLEFVRNLQPDLGVIYGTRILKPELFSLPRLGSVNVHKHKVPDYRGAGAPGLWEMRDDQPEQTVTIHRVTTNVDAGGVLGERTFPIEQWDTLTSVGLKADLLAVDCLVDVINRERHGESVEIVQPDRGRVYKGFQPHQIWAIERQIRKKRRSFRPKRGRPLIKLAVRTLGYLPLFFENRRRAREKNFPVVILFHHLIADRDKYMALPTDYFLRHVRFLKEHYRIVSVSNAIEMLERGRIDAPTVALTFDDGYADNFLALRAVAEAEQIPITLFVCTEHVTESSEFQHDIDREEHGFPAFTWDQLRYLHKHGACIGSHTRTHFDCGDTDENRLRYEILGSLEDLRQELDEDVVFFSFPKGHPQNMSEPARRLAGQTYRHLFSACGGVNIAPLQPGAILKRCSHPASLFELELTLQSLLERH